MAAARARRRLSLSGSPWCRPLTARATTALGASQTAHTPGLHPRPLPGHVRPAFGRDWPRHARTHLGHGWPGGPAPRGSLQVRNLNRIMLDAEEVEADGATVLLPPEDYRARHILEVLKAAPGRGGAGGGEAEGAEPKVLRVGIVDGPTGTAVVAPPEESDACSPEESGEGAVRLQCAFADPPAPTAAPAAPIDIDIEGLRTLHLPSPLSAAPRPPPGVGWEGAGEAGVDLVLAAPRPRVLRRLLPVVSQLGVRSLVVCNANRVEKGYLKGGVISQERRMRELLVEGLSQQAVDTALPRVSVAVHLRPLVEDLLSAPGRYRHKLLLHPSPAGRRMRDLPPAGPGEGVLLAIGPEGGWLDHEVAMLQAAGFLCVSMGDRILRTDVATIAAIMLAREVLLGPGQPEPAD